MFESTNRSALNYDLQNLYRRVPYHWPKKVSVEFFSVVIYTS